LVALDPLVWFWCYRQDPEGDLSFDFPGDLDPLREALGGQVRRPPPKKRWSHVNVIYDSTTRSLRVLGGRGSGAAFHLEPSGALLVVEAGRRIVRLGPEPGRREVLFPRR
jgi:hypothetical protein